MQESRRSENQIQEAPSLSQLSEPSALLESQAAAAASDSIPRLLMADISEEIKDWVCLPGTLRDQAGLNLDERTEIVRHKY